MEYLVTKVRSRGGAYESEGQLRAVIISSSLA